jgi:hypothetical protein
MAACVCCGRSIPDGQSTCSMCYGDIDHGSDGYYREWMERGAEIAAEQRAAEDRAYENLQREENDQ